MYLYVRHISCYTQMIRKKITLKNYKWNKTDTNTPLGGLLQMGSGGELLALPHTPPVVSDQEK